MTATIVDRNELVIAAVCPYFFGQNPGHVIVMPTEHFENLYVMPANYLHACVDMARSVALTMKEAYGAAGITLRQNNEPAGGQTAFHFHLHVYPRYSDDGFDTHPAEYLVEPAERAQWAQRLRGPAGPGHRGSLSPGSAAATRPSLLCHHDNVAVAPAGAVAVRCRTIKLLS
jgi:histidine triad (HIT) family protein